jgi:4'-phosphopantetheinyl transferase
MYVRPAHNEIHLIFSSLAAGPEFLDRLWHSLSPDERDKARRFRFDKHRNSFIVARGLLRIILGRCIEAESSDITFVYGSHGKPALSDGEHIRFNLSHSEDIVLYAVGEDLDLGVDVEYIRPMQDLEHIACRFFCSAEQHELLTLPEDRRAKAFFDCWTRKEAFIKAVGDGLSHPLDRFQVTLRPEQPAEFVSLDGHPSSETQWMLYDAAPSEDFAAALAVENRNCRLRVWTFESPVNVGEFCGYRSR